MEGQIAITEDLVNQNKMGWGIFDFFKHQLKSFTSSITAGWYAYKLEDGIYSFRWCDQDDRPSKGYLKALERD